MQCGVNNICRRKIYDNNSTKARRGETEVYRYHLKIDYDKLKMHTINPKATAKVIKQKVIANKQTKEEKWSHKNTQLKM